MGCTQAKTIDSPTESQQPRHPARPPRIESTDHTVKTEPLIERESGQNSQSRVIKSITLVWLDSNISLSDADVQFALKEFKLIFGVVKILTSIKECIEFVNDLKQKIVFLIVSGQLGQQFIPVIHDERQLLSIYVFCGNKAKHELWAKMYKKVKGVFIQIMDVLETVRRDIQQYQRTSMSLRVVTASFFIDSDGLDHSFMYSQLLKEILLEMEYNTNSKQEFVNFVRIHYTCNKSILDVIDEFEKNYDHSATIWWYTRVCFIYFFLNKALRTQDLDTIIMMGFIVRDLHRQIEKLHSESKNNELITVYRGQGVSSIELDKIKSNQGGLISFYNFLSTSLDKQFSLAYAVSARDDPELIGILFEMTIDPTTSAIPFVCLNGISYYADNEQEYLFSMNTIFRIDSCKQCDHRLWEVHLTLASNSDEQLKLLTDHMRREGEGKTVLQRLGHLMFKMDELDKAEKLFQTLIVSASSNDWDQLLYAHYQLGYINSGRNKHVDALYHYSQSAEIALQHRPSTDSELFRSYSNVGVIFQKQGNLDEAMKYFQLAISIESQAENPDQLAISKRYINKASVFEQQGKFAEALSIYERALKIQLVHVPPRDPFLIDTYKGMAAVQYSSKNYSAVLKTYEKILEIQQRTLQYNDISLAETHNYMATIFEDLKQYKEAVEHASEAIKIACRAFGPTQLQIKFYGEYHEQLLKKMQTL